MITEAIAAISIAIIVLVIYHIFKILVRAKHRVDIYLGYPTETVYKSNIHFSSSKNSHSSSPSSSHPQTESEHPQNAPIQYLNHDDVSLKYIFLKIINYNDIRLNFENALKSFKHDDNKFRLELYLINENNIKYNYRLYTQTTSSKSQHYAAIAYITTISPTTISALSNDITKKNITTSVIKHLESQNIYNIFDGYHLLHQSKTTTEQSNYGPFYNDKNCFDKINESFFHNSICSESKFNESPDEYIACCENNDLDFANPNNQNITHQLVTFSQ